MKTRSDIHNEMYEAYMAMGSLDTGIKASVIKGTGTGKSYDGIAIVEAVTIHVTIKEQRLPNILLLSNSTRLRDVTWKEEFIKWNQESLIPYCTMECYQTAYKWENTHWDLVIADEGDFALTEEYSKFFTNNSYDNLLLMTGYVAPRKRELLNKIAPVCYTYTTQQAQDEGVLNKTQFTIVQYDLSRLKNIAKKGKYGVYYTSENDEYIYLETQWKLSMVNLEKVKNLPRTTIQEITKLEKRVQITASKRKSFLWSLKSSRNATRRLLKAITEKDESNKVLVFSKLTDQIDRICKNTYHSKNKKDNDNINLLNESEIRVLGVCDAVNRGENFIGVNYAIKESYSGSPTDFQQQNGRLTRLDADDVANLYIMVPYYHDKLGVRKPTQALTWMNNMTAGFDLSNKKEYKLV